MVVNANRDFVLYFMALLYLFLCVRLWGTRKRDKEFIPYEMC